MSGENSSDNRSCLERGGLSNAACRGAASGTGVALRVGSGTRVPVLSDLAEARRLLASRGVARRVIGRYHQSARVRKAGSGLEWARRRRVTGVGIFNGSAGVARTLRH